MALPTPEETLMGVTQYNPRKKKAPVVPIRVERREPPKVLKKPGTSEWVGTQKPTEQQKAEKPVEIKEYEKNEHLNSYGRRRAHKKYVAEATAYNQSVKTYNEAIGHKTPAENKAIAERLLKKTQPKTVMVA